MDASPETREGRRPPAPDRRSGGRGAGGGPVIGVTGPACAGKSEVARILAAAGARVVDVDRVGHEALAQPDCRARVLARFGREVAGDDGGVDRARLRRLVFADPDRLRALEEILHPVMRARIERKLPGLRADAPVVLDAALLLPMGLDGLCDALLLVEAPFPARLERARARGWSEAELRDSDRRLAPALAEAGRRADLVVKNDGTVPALRAVVNRFFEELTHATEKENH